LFVGLSFFFCGTGKAKEVPAAIKKGIEAAKKESCKLNVLETPFLHAVLGRSANRGGWTGTVETCSGWNGGREDRFARDSSGGKSERVKKSMARIIRQVVKADHQTRGTARDKAQVAEMRGIALRQSHVLVAGECSPSR